MSEEKPAEPQTEAQKEYDAMCKRLEAIEDRLGLNKPKPTKDQILRARKRC